MEKNFKRLLSFAVALFMVLGIVPGNVFKAFAAEADALGTAPQLPTATVSTIENDDLTFAVNFKADQATDAQLTYYGDWYADYVLTFNKDVTLNADGGADGYLSGQYDAWSENWVNVPFNKGNVSLAAGQELQIMKFAAELMGEPGLRYTCREAYEVVKNFDCGAFLTEEYLEANPDLEVTLELRIYNDKNESEWYVIGDTYVFTAQIPQLPTATVSTIENDDLTFAANFKADKATNAQLTYYGDWYADYVLTFNKDVTLNADGGADGYLSGQYDAWSENWVNVPFNKGNVSLAAGQELQIMKFAAELMGEPGLRYTCREAYEVVKNFDCGAFLTEEYLEANPDLEVTLELRIYNDKNESETYVIGDTKVFRLSENVAQNVQTGKQYATVAAALAEAQQGQTVRLLKNVTGEKAESLILLFNARTLDLNGYILEAGDVLAANAYAHIVDNTNGKGLLKVAKDHLTLPKNDQLPIWIAEEGGFRLVTPVMGIGKFDEYSDAEKLVLGYYFDGAMDDVASGMRQQLGKTSENDIKVILRVDYVLSAGYEGSLNVFTPEAMLNQYAAYGEGQYPSISVVLRGLNAVQSAKITTYVVYEDIEIACATYDYEIIE